MPLGNIIPIIALGCFFPGLSSWAEEVDPRLGLNQKNAVAESAAGSGDRSVWRSVLYPADWTPLHSRNDGMFLHDFSYSGYRNGEAEIPSPDGPIFDVVADFGADAKGVADSSDAIQKAIDAASAAGGGVVFIPKGLFLCANPLRVSSSNIVIRGAGMEKTLLLFPFVPGRWQEHIQIVGNPRAVSEIPLASDGENRSFVLELKDTGDIAEGDDIDVGWVISPEFIAEHEMNGVWKAFNDRWHPFFLRDVKKIAIDSQPPRITIDVPLRYQAKVRDRASVRKLRGYISECGIEDLSVSNAVSPEDAWSTYQVHAIGLKGVKDCWARRVGSFPSPLPEANGTHLQNGGILISNSKRVTISECSMSHAQNRGGGGCGYLFHISRSSEILTRDCVGAGGRHNFIQNWDFGSSGLVWLRCTSRDGRGFTSRDDVKGWVGYSEYHHSLAMACLVDSCVLDDGWFGGNRLHWSDGAGSTVTQSVYWNTSGKGVIRSWQSGHGYIIGTCDIKVLTNMDSPHAAGTAPEDFREGLGRSASLVPKSLYEDQLRRRVNRSK